MADINGRPNLLEDYLMTLHNESWFYFTDINNKTYENLRLSEKIWDAINKTIIDNPHSLPLEMECNTGLENLKSQWDAKQYQRDRVYPSIGDQLDMLWHTMDKDTELQHKFYDFYQTIKKVKVAHPKK